jgi:hypothetical protein
MQNHKVTEIVESQMRERGSMVGEPGERVGEPVPRIWRIEGRERERGRFIENNYLRYFVVDRAVIYGAGNYLQAHVRLLQSEHVYKAGRVRRRQSRRVRMYTSFIDVYVRGVRVRM